MLTIRRAWQCDCDGESHKALGREPHPADMAMKTMRRVIGEYTGQEPPTCPWRAMYEPIVDAAIRIATLADQGLGAAAVDEDTPAVWVDAVRVYLAAREGTRARDAKDRHERRMKEMRRK